MLLYTNRFDTIGLYEKDLFKYVRAISFSGNARFCSVQMHNIIDVVWDDEDCGAVAVWGRGYGLKFVCDFKCHIGSIWIFWAFIWF